MLVLPSGTMKLKLVEVTLVGTSPGWSAGVTILHDQLIISLAQFESCLSIHGWIISLNPYCLAN